MWDIFVFIPVKRPKSTRLPARHLFHRKQYYKDLYNQHMNASYILIVNNGRFGEKNGEYTTT